MWDIWIWYMNSFEKPLWGKLIVGVNDFRVRSYSSINFKLLSIGLSASYIYKKMACTKISV